MQKKKDGNKKYFHLHSYYSLLKTCVIGTIMNQKLPEGWVLEQTFSIEFSIALRNSILTAYMLTV